MKKRGKGLAAIYFGMGNTAKPNPSSAFVELLEDGSAVIRCGVADLGQGSDTTMVQIAAETLGISPEKVSIKSADTLITPEAGNSSASRQTYVSGNAVRLAAEQVRETLLAQAADELGANLDDLVVSDDEIFLPAMPERRLTVKQVCEQLRARGVLTVGAGTFTPPTPLALDPETGAGIPYGAYSYATQLVEVEVDDETGEFQVVKVTAAHDLGKVVNPMGVEGQMEGGIVMGLGYGMMEEILWDDHGQMLTTGLDTYVIPTALDAPPQLSLTVEDPEPTGPFGAKGTGEPPACPTAAALVSAIYDAVGVDITSLPVTAEKVYMGLQELKAAGRG